MRFLDFIFAPLHINVRARNCAILVSMSEEFAVIFGLYDIICLPLHSQKKRTTQRRRWL